MTVIQRPANWNMVRSISLSLVTDLRNSFEGTFFILWDAPGGPEVYGFIGEPLDDKVLFAKIGTTTISLADVPESYKTSLFSWCRTLCYKHDFSIDITTLVETQEVRYEQSN